MLESDLRCIEGSIKTAGRRMCRHNHHRALAVAAVERLIEVGLFGLCRDAGRRTCALHVHHHERKLGHHREAEGLGFKRKAWA